MCGVGCAFVRVVCSVSRSATFDTKNITIQTHHVRPARQPRTCSTQTHGIQPSTLHKACACGLLRISTRQPLSRCSLDTALSPNCTIPSLLALSVSSRRSAPRDLRRQALLLLKTRRIAYPKTKTGRHTSGVYAGALRRAVGVRSRSVALPAAMIGACGTIQPSPRGSTGTPQRSVASGPGTARIFLLHTSGLT